MYIPKVKSLTDLLLWLPRFVYNLGFKAHAFLVAALAILPIVLTTFETVHTPEGVLVKLENAGYLSTGNFEDNEDSLYLAKNSEVRLLAKQQSAFWAETANGSHRGFLKAKTVGEQAESISLPRREKRSCYLVSEKKFKSIIEGATLEEIQKKYLNAEYIKSNRKHIIAEFGFKVFVGQDASGGFHRPIVTYDKEGNFVKYELAFWHMARARMIDPITLDVVAPLASISEFPIKSPFESLWLQKLWIYLPGLALLGLFAILLVLRIPLIWAPNLLVGFVIYGLALFPPFLWLTAVKTYGVAGWVIVPYVIMLFVNVLLLWLSYDGLRCPKCKHLNVHEFSAKRNGKSYWKSEVSTHEVERGPKLHERWGNWEYGKEWLGDESSSFSTLQKYNDAKNPNQWRSVSYRVHSWVQVVTYRDKVTQRLIQEVIHSYKCPHCGHGKDEIEQTTVDSQSEWKNGTYKETFDYQEKVSNDGKVYDHTCKKR